MLVTSSEINIVELTIRFPIGIHQTDVSAVI